MERVIILGSAAAVSNIHHENTHLLLQAGTRMVLVDCPGNPLNNIRKTGINPLDLTDVILTHFHPDHVSGFALLLMDLWLIKRSTPLNVYGLSHTIERAEAMLDLYEWQDWPNFYPVHFHRLPDEENFPFMDDTSIALYSSPVKHLIPTLGIRVVFKRSRKILTYSSDTEPTEIVARLAQNADMLIHEATGEGIGHSSASQAGEIAQRAGVKSLFLIHYPPEEDKQAIINQAQSKFQGGVGIAEDYLQLDF